MHICKVLSRFRPVFARGSMTLDCRFLRWHSSAGVPVAGNTPAARVRTIAVDELVSVRRFETASRGGGSSDELRLRDRHGVSLAIEGNAADASVRRAVLVAPSGSIKVSRAALADSVRASVGGALGPCVYC